MLSRAYKKAALTNVLYWKTIKFNLNYTVISKCSCDYGGQNWKKKKDQSITASLHWVSATCQELCINSSSNPPRQKLTPYNRCRRQGSNSQLLRHLVSGTTQHTEEPGFNPNSVLFWFHLSSHYIVLPPGENAATKAGANPSPSPRAYIVSFLPILVSESLSPST